MARSSMRGYVSASSRRSARPIGLHIEKIVWRRHLNDGAVLALFTAIAKHIELYVIGAENVDRENSMHRFWQYSESCERTFRLLLKLPQ